MGWEEAWELYQDTHADADWYDFEREYWGDDEEDEEDEELNEFDEDEEEDDDEYDLSENEIDAIHKMWHPNETPEEFAEHEDF